MFSSAQMPSLLARTLKSAARIHSTNRLLLQTSARSFSGFQKFDYKDPLRFDDLLTEEELMIQETARNYAREKLLPRVTQAY